MEAGSAALVPDRAKVDALRERMAKEGLELGRADLDVDVFVQRFVTAREEDSKDPLEGAWKQVSP